MFDGLDATTQALFITPDMLPVWIEKVRPHLARITAASDGRYEGADLVTALASGKLQLWIALRSVDVMAVMLTEIQQYPRLRSLRIVALIGRNPLAWRRLLPRIEETARQDFDCQRLEVIHEPRMAALLPGYRTTHWFSEKALG